MSFTRFRRPVGRPGVILAALAALLLALPGAALAAGVSLRIAANHSPVVGKLWYLTLYVTHNGQKLSGHVDRYNFLFGGQVVSHQPAGNRSNHFGDFHNGYFRDDLSFPARSLGYPLTLQVVVSTRYGTQSVNWAVKPVK